MFSIENVIHTRFPAFPQKNPKTYRTLVALLKVLFKEAEFQKFSAHYPHIKGFDFVEQVLEHFDFAISISDRERERIPVWGKVVIIANHPIGSLDGLALLKLVGQVRRDVKVVANDVLQTLEPLQSLLLPVDNMGANTTRENIRAIEQHLQQEGAVIIFPSGEVSRFSPKGVRDGKWQQGFLRFATKAQAPILPIFINARNSAFFYGLSILAKPLSTWWLVREMFKHSNNTVRIHIGQAIGFETYHHVPLKGYARIKLFKRHLYKIGKNQGESLFKDESRSIAHPEDRQQLRQALRNCEQLGKIRDNLPIYLYHFSDDSPIMREIGRLREVSFRAVGEGSGRRRDIDAFDKHYDHIVLWDDEALELVGAYRLRRVQAGCDSPAGGRDGQATGIENLYSHTLFDYHPSSQEFLRQGIELGRSFVQPRYWRQNGLDLLWRGIGAYARQYPDARYLFGPVSISNSFPAHAQALLVSFYQHYYPSPFSWASARTPYALPHEGYAQKWQDMEAKTAYTLLKKELEASSVSIPPLYKQYADVCEPGGVQFCAFNIDKDFADCIDGLVCVDLNQLKAPKRKRYFASAEEN